MAIGCTNPNAKNYDPLATEDDGSCVYLAHVDDVCYAFEDESPSSLVENSFTLSLSIKGGAWVFYHDYIPDYYFHTRTKLHNLSNKKIRIHNENLPGVFYDEQPKPFFIDVVIKANPNAILNSIAWLTETVIGTGTLAAGSHDPMKTITHVTIWNDLQCSDRIALKPFQNITQGGNTRYSRAHWVFNEIKNAIFDEGPGFLTDLFHDFRVLDQRLDHGSRSWYDIDYLRGDYFILRLENDNLTEETVLLHDFNADTTQDVRF